ncbi:hypothetical protein [Pseudolysinimonas sp.]|jgi:hypothetical protein|uniref:hypothetical protein n=1 Tax=Pseudolysinimonas sp. TaxID=2680009 RepID=UPI00378420BE
MTAEGSGIDVDYVRLDALDVDLTRALGTLTDDLEVSAGLALVVGDAGLAAAAIDFGQDWNFHRFVIRDQVEWLRDSLRNVRVSLQEWEAAQKRATTG